MRNRLLFLGLVIVALALPFGLFSQASQTEWRNTPFAAHAPGSVILNLLSNKNTIVSGDDIQIRITLHALAPVKMLGVGSVYETDVRVTDADGHAVSMAKEKSGPGTFTGRYFHFRAGDTWVVTKGPNGFEPLSHWGYELKSPGTYHVQASLKNSQVRSNVVAITVDAKELGLFAYSLERNPDRLVP